MSHGRLVTMTCLRCGQEYQGTTSEQKKGRRYCSQSCGARNRPILRGEQSTNWKGGLPTHTCIQCGKEYQRARRRTYTFCGRGCYTAWLKTRTGPLAPRWEGGIGFEPYPPTFNTEFKRRIRERDGYQCALCQAPGSKAVHHINYIKDDTNPENCVTLCVSCHAKTNSNRVWWQAYFEQAMQQVGYAPAPKRRIKKG